MLLLLCTLQISTDTLNIRTVERPPAAGEAVDSSRQGPPQVRLPTKQGAAHVWLIQAADTFFIAATIPDSTPYWGDNLVLSMNPRGEAGTHPGHNDFQWDFRRALDSTVIYRGRGGRWEAPRGDADWRLGADRSGGGWEVSSRDDAKSWSVVLRLDPAWLKSGEGRLPRVAFRIYDNSPQSWSAWPNPSGTTAVSVEQSPRLWGYISQQKN